MSDSRAAWAADEAADRQRETRVKAEDMERGMVAGTKYVPEDLEWYIDYKQRQLRGQSEFWRHRESGGVYKVVDIGLAATGSGVLAPMVHYVPQGRQGPRFERQLSFFHERFEPVRAATVWEAVV